MTTLKTRLAGGAAPYFPANRFGAPGMLRGVTLSRGPEDDNGGGGGDDDNGGGEPPVVIDPAAHAALVANHDRLKKDAKADRDALKVLRDQVAEIQRQKDDAEHEVANKSGDVAAVKKQLEDRHAVALKAETDRADKAEAQVRKLVVNNNLSRELDAVRIKPDLKKAATAMLLLEGIELEDGDDDEPVAMKGGLPLAQAIKLWAESEEGKSFILDGNSGGGVPPGGKGSGKNPWAQGTWNVTEQDAVEAKNPALAGRLKAEAGVTD